MIVAPNFLSVRMTDDDKNNYSKVAEHMERKTGLRLSQGDVFRLAMQAYAEKHNIKTA
jgi:hypothetical protein